MPRRFGLRLALVCVLGLSTACAGGDGDDTSSTSDGDAPVMTRLPGQNRLALETSPYLLQHANNPVDWYPWGDEAFELARNTGKPLLVSIGYSSCHWCHVMEHESFEDEETARLMNELFVCVKVDREERPDVDEIYMSAMQMMGMGGGWPLNVFLTPDRVPFYGGTYFPPDRRYGRPSWKEVLAQVAAGWRDHQGEIATQGKEVLAALDRNSAFPSVADVPEVALLESAMETVLGGFDEVNGGFGGAPKFPRVPSLQLALTWHARRGDARHLEVVEYTLRKMAEGGIYDQLGGGFHRYSTDEKWLVPHFEKMLYDNAQLARIYVEAFQVTGDPFYERIARETLDYVLREMTEPEGGFRSATDADSDGREGVYFVWKEAEVAELLGKDASLFARAYGVTEDGNFVDPHHPRQPGEQGMNVLHVSMTVEELAKADGLTVKEVESRLERSREKLMKHREGRTYPMLDDKVLASWNGLMISAMAYGGRALGEERYVDAAAKAGAFVAREMRTDDGRLLRTHRGGRSKIPAFLEDYAYLSNAYLDLYEATFDLQWFRMATELAEETNRLFSDPDGGAWFHTASDGEELVTRTRSAYDGAIPSANGIAAQTMIRLATMTGRDEYRVAAELAIRRFGAPLEKQPGGTVTLLRALDALLHEDGEIAFVGKSGDKSTQRLIRPVHRAYLPGTVFALLAPGKSDAEDLIPMLAGKTLVGGEEAVYVCRNFSCQAPVTTVDEVEQAIAGL